MSSLNPLNDISRIYLDHVANANQKEEEKDIKRWETGNEVLDKQMETSTKELATLGAPLSKEEVELDEAERSIDDRLDRKNKLMKKTTRKAMDFARDEGEASGHARFNMSRLGEKEKSL